MIQRKNIQIFEHQRLYVGERGFSQKHLDALLKLNDYHEGAYFEPISKGIKFNQYVGVIQVDGLTIEIHPKADKYANDSQWQNVLLQMLQACGRIKAQSAGAAHVNRQNLNLLEVYFELYLLEVQGLVHRGLIKKYRKEQSNVKALKGKLEFAQNIRYNLVHKERFFTTHQVYDTNHELHQIISFALEIVEQYTRGTRLFDLCKRVQLDFPEVDKKNITSKLLDSIVLNRKSAPYSYAIELARLIILNYSPDITGGQEKMLSLLFNMNELWEEYVLVQIQKYIEVNKLDYQVTGQESKSFWGSNSLRPDIVLKKGSETFVLDTKWKVPGKSSASVSDLRQMYTYNRFWDADKAILLYPGSNSRTKFKSFETDDYYLEGTNHKHVKHQCKMGFVNVVDKDGKLVEIGGEIINQLEDQ